MTRESETARYVLFELGVRKDAKAWLTYRGNRLYVETPYKEITTTVNLRGYDWTRTGDLISIDITDICRPKRKKKEPAPFGL